MDIRDPKWHCQLTITGVGNPINTAGSVLGIFAEVSKHLQQTNPRVLASGGREIVIRIRDTAFSSNKESLDSHNLILELESQLDSTDIDNGPSADEDYTAFVARLMTTGISIAAAMMIAGDWFDEPAPKGLVEWMNDPKAARFRQLNASREEYEKASPGEYAILKKHVLAEHPSFVAALTLREV